MDKEPALINGGNVALIGAALTLLVSFGVHLTADQVKAVLGFVAIAGPLVTAWLTRRKVFAPATVAADFRPLPGVDYTRPETASEGPPPLAAAPKATTVRKPRANS